MNSGSRSSATRTKWARRSNQYLSNPLPAGGYAALCRDNLPVVVPAVSRAADHRQADPAVVRRLGRRLDDLPGVLPERPARGVRVRGPDDAARAAPPGAAARRPARGFARLPADPRLERLEAPRQR